MNLLKTKHSYSLEKSAPAKSGRYTFHHTPTRDGFRIIVQVLFVGSVLQWPGWGSLPVASDKFSLLAAPFHLPSNRSASLLDLQIRVDDSVSFLISAWKSHNDELVIAKTSLPLLTEGPSQPLPNLGSQTFEWQNNEKKQRRLQDEVVVQRLRDDLSSGLSFLEKEDAVKACYCFLLEL